MVDAAAAVLSQAYLPLIAQLPLQAAPRPSSSSSATRGANHPLTLTHNTAVQSLPPSRQTAQDKALAKLGNNSFPLSPHKRAHPAVMIDLSEHCTALVVLDECLGVGSADPSRLAHCLGGWWFVWLIGEQTSLRFDCHCPLHHEKLLLRPRLNCTNHTNKIHWLESPVLSHTCGNRQQEATTALQPHRC